MLEQIPSKKNLQTQRYGFVDQCKFIAIYLVILGHRPLPLWLNNFIFDFHIPLFFLISGFLFSFDKHANYTEFVKTRARQLLVPYLTFNIITYVFWVTVGQRFGGDVARSVPFYKPLIGIFYGNGINGYLQHCVPIWFLACLFTVENIYYLLFRRIEKKWLLIIGMAVIGYVDYYFGFLRLPWGINLAPTAIVFYGLGHICKKYIRQFAQQAWWLLLAEAFLFFMITLAISYTNGNASMNDRLFGHHYLLFICSGISGSILLIAGSSLFDMFFKGQRLVEYISRNTIVIIAFQNLIATLMKGVLIFAFKIPLIVFENAILSNVLFSIINLLCAVPLIYVLNKYFPYLLGRWDKSASKTVASPGGNVPV